MIMSNKIFTQQGLTNKAALAVIATGYPLGMMLCSLVYISSVKDTFWKGNGIEQAHMQARFSKNDASKLIEEWWIARNEVYGPPYDRTKAKGIISVKGPLWKTLDNTKSPIKWLKENRRSQQFTGKIKAITSFDSEQERPVMTAVIEATTSIKGGSNKVSKEKTTSKIYNIVFDYEDGKWKIWNYKSQS